MVSAGRGVVDDVAGVVGIESLRVSSGGAVVYAGVVVEAIAIDALPFHVLDALSYHVAT